MNGCGALNNSTEVSVLGKLKHKHCKAEVSLG